MELSEAAKNLKPGIYEHFKGKQYEVIGVAHHSETLEELVVYRALYGGGPSTMSSGPNGDLWVRPLDMFLETVERDGQKFPRFKFIK